jgi:tetratricopeptide (TPR) repeat protein
LEIFSISAPELHPDRVFVQLELGDVLQQQHRLAEAAELIERAVTAQRVIYNNAGPQLAQSLVTLGGVRTSQNRLSEAEALLVEALELTTRGLGVSHYTTGYYHTSLAVLFVKMGRYADAEKHLNTALEIFADTLPKDHQYVASAKHWLGEALLRSGNPDRAATELDEAFDIWISSKAPAWLAARTESALGAALVQSGHPKEGKARLAHSYETLRRDRGSDDEETVNAQRRLENSDSPRTKMSQ